jgi:hypothetical protein
LTLFQGIFDNNFENFEARPIRFEVKISLIEKIRNMFFRNKKKNYE